MKLSFLNKGLTSLKDTLRLLLKPAGKVDKNAPSRHVRIIGGEMSYLASVRRNIRHQALQRVRRNTKGLPLGCRTEPMRKCDEKKIKTVRRFVDGEWKEQPHMFVEQSQEVREALKFGEELRKTKLSKIARRVSGKRRRSCSAKISMLDIMERREMLAGRA